MKLTLVIPSKLLLILTFSACQSDESNHQSNLIDPTKQEILTPKKEKPSESELFDQYLRLVPQSGLPYEFDCQIDYKTSAIKSDSFIKFIPSGGNNPNYLKSNSPNDLIIYHFAADVIYPVLYTFDSLGQKIDSLWLYKGSCNEDPWIESRCYTKIDTDLTIQISDTSKHFFYNDTIQRLDSTTIETDFYQILENGQFKWVKNESYRMN